MLYCMYILRTYVRSDELMKDEGREAYVSEIAGRFVIPVTPTYKRTVGIVHDSSRTGKTLYVEPTQVRDPYLYVVSPYWCGEARRGVSRFIAWHARIYIPGTYVGCSDMDK